MIPIFGNKKFDEIKEPDLLRLRDKQVRENRFIEYKREYKQNDDEVTEMLADITAFANAQGGYLFIGIEEESKENPIPKDLVGIGNAEIEADRIRKRCESCIDEYIQGLQVTTIPLSNRRGVVAVFIPNSSRKPHMITFKGKNRFYIRRDEGKSPMNIEEIRDTILKVEDYMRKLEDFLEKRKTDLTNEIRDSLGNGCWMVLSATPVFISERLDVTTSNEIIKLMRYLELPADINKKNTPTASISIPSESPKITINGLRSEDLKGYDTEGIGKYLEVWDQGYIEFGFSLQGDSKDRLIKSSRTYRDKARAQQIISYLIPNPTIFDLIMSFCVFVDKIRRILQINEPIVYRLMFLNCELIALDVHPNLTEKIIYWPKPELIIRPSKSYLAEAYSQIGKELITKIFRVFGFFEPFYYPDFVNRKPLFSADGIYKP